MLRRNFKLCTTSVTQLPHLTPRNHLTHPLSGKNLVDAAKAAGVRHFVWSSLEDTRPALAATRAPLDAAGRTVPHFDAKAEVEAYLREQVGRYRCAVPRHGGTAAQYHPMHAAVLLG
jgi:hypothetical protein